MVSDNLTVEMSTATRKTPAESYLTGYCGTHKNERDVLCIQRSRGGEKRTRRKCMWCDVMSVYEDHLLCVRNTTTGVHTNQGTYHLQ